MNDVERAQFEKRLKRSLEEKIKEIRDNLMEQTQFKSSPQLNRVMLDYLIHIEDCEAGRLNKDEIGASKRKFEVDIKSLVPVGYKVKMIHFWFQTLEIDKIVTAVCN